MNAKRQAYVGELRELGEDPADVAEFLVANSHLPGPRGNLELAEAFADWAPTSMVDVFAQGGAPRPAAGGDEFFDFCVTLALAERLAHDDDPALAWLLRTIAGDERWRVREAVATGLQRVGDTDFTRLREVVEVWAEDGDPLVQRAAVAAACEPRLLRDRAAAATALAVCGTTTRKLAAMPLEARRKTSVRVLRQALGYCWSVAVAADPGAGLGVFLALSESQDPDVAWIVRENLKKSRLKRLLPQGAH